MEPWLDDGDVRLYLGDCVEVMAAMDAESVDAVVCDPPYGLEFMGKEWDRADSPAAFAAWCEMWAREALRVLKPGGHLLAFGGTRTFHRLTCGLEDAGFEIRDCLSWLYGSGFPKSLDVSKAIDKAAGAEREVVGVRSYPTQPNGRSNIGQGYSVAGTAGTEVGNFVTAPATDAAREWQGWGTALKPAWEPCVVARKPPAGTVAENVQQHDTGALNIDGCRFGIVNAERTAGRWPANVALDEQAAAMLDAQSGVSTSRSALMPLPQGHAFAGSVYGGDGAANGASVRGHNDAGGASRFFYTAKASRSDRNTSGANNTHPTVKPTDLMRWLVRMVTPPGGVVLDPFAGSGSTLVAARAEGVRAIGIEQAEEYAAIIRDRLAQLSLFSEGMASDD